MQVCIWIIVAGSCCPKICRSVLIRAIRQSNGQQADSVPSPTIRKAHVPPYNSPPSEVRVRARSCHLRDRTQPAIDPLRKVDVVSLRMRLQPAAGNLASDEQLLASSQGLTMGRVLLAALSWLFVTTAAAETHFTAARESMVSTIQTLAKTVPLPSTSGEIDPSVLDSMREVPRHEFVPEDVRQAAYENRPLPIGHGQ